MKIAAILENPKLMVMNSLMTARLFLEHRSIMLQMQIRSRSEPFIHGSSAFAR